MKKLLIFLFIALGLISCFGYMANSDAALLKKLDKFTKIENIYYQADISFKFMNLQDTNMILKQFKRGNNYNAILISPLSRTQNIIQVADGKLTYEQMFMTVEGSAEESKADRSIFWFDKIKPSDIKQDSIRKQKTPEYLESKKCTFYTAEMAETNDKFDICIDKNNIPVYIKYYDVRNFIPLLFDINPVTSVTKNNGDITIKLTDIKIDPEYDTSFDLPEMSKFGIKTTVKEMKKEMEKQKKQYAELNDAMRELQSLTKDLQNLGSELEDEEDEE